MFIYLFQKNTILEKKMDEKYDELMKEWIKSYSRSRQRDYYFNPKTGESLWTLDEVKERVLRSLNKKSDQIK